MITKVSAPAGRTEPIKLVGLSTDEKPAVWNGSAIPNGSEMIELDTGKKYEFSSANSDWNKQHDGEVTNDIATDEEVKEALDELFLGHK